MKKTLLKVLSSTIALTLVATAALSTAPAKEIPVQDINTRPAQTEEVKDAKENTVLEVLEAKVKEEKAEEIKEAKTPVVEMSKAEPVKKATPVKAAEEVAVPVEAVKEKSEAPAVETSEIPEASEEAEPVMVWDISATEHDSVAMVFYADNVTPDAAAEQVEIDAQTGTVYIRGTGAMEESIYKHFISTENYLNAIKTLFEDYYGIDVDLVYDESLDDIIAIDETLKVVAHETGEPLSLTEEMRNMIDPRAFLAYSPTTIVIEEGITNISDYAFICCANIETVVLPSTIEAIGICAFEYCDRLTSIVIPENAAIGQEAFAYCDSLANVQFAGDDYYNNVARLSDGETSFTRVLTPDEISILVNCNN